MDILCEDGPGDGDEGGVDLRLAVGGFDGLGIFVNDGLDGGERWVAYVAVGQKSDFRAGCHGFWVVGGGSQHGECLHGQRRVGRWAGFDEWRGEGVDFVVLQGNIEGGWEGALGKRVADVGRVTRFDGQDGSRGGQVVLAHDVCGGTEVAVCVLVRRVLHSSCRRQSGLRGDSNTLEDGGSGDTHVDRGQAEVIGAFFDRSDPGRLQGGCQKADMGALILGNGLQVGVKGGREAGSFEVALREFVQDFAVELVLQMLQSESIVEDVAVRNGGSRLTDCKQAVPRLVLYASSWGITHLFFAGAAAATAAKAATEKIVDFMMFEARTIEAQIWMKTGTGAGKGGNCLDFLCESKHEAGPGKEKEEYAYST